MESVSWNWAAVEERAMWEDPAEESYYLAHRWTRDGRRRVLDLGCGLGRHSLLFARAGMSVDACDLSPDAVRELGERGRAAGLAVTVRRGDMLSLPYPDGAFDCLLAFHVIYHTDRPGLERIVSEIRRVLVPGGELFVTLNSTESPQLRDPRFRRVAPNVIVKTEGAEKGVPHIYVDETDVRELMAGFTLHLFHHKQEIGPDWRAAHWFLLAEKPRG
jgi:SAM-dependent methyltransferase